MVLPTETTLFVHFYLQYRFNFNDECNCLLSVYSHPRTMVCSVFLLIVSLFCWLYISLVAFLCVPFFVFYGDAIIRVFYCIPIWQGEKKGQRLMRILKYCLSERHCHHHEWWGSICDRNLGISPCAHRASFMTRIFWNRMFLFFTRKSLRWESSMTFFREATNCFLVLNSCNINFYWAGQRRSWL